MAASVMLQATQLGLAGPDFKQRAKHNRMAVLLTPTNELANRQRYYRSAIAIVGLHRTVCNTQEPADARREPDDSGTLRNHNAMDDLEDRPG
jgi:hypothetical protein